jgi:hypothetical protein
VSIQLASEQDIPGTRNALADPLRTRTDGAANALMFDKKVDGTRLILTLSPAALTQIASSVCLARRRK